MFAVKNRKIFFTISGIMLAVSYLLMILWGFNFGTDFKGGTLVEVNYVGKSATKLQVEESVRVLDFGEPSVRTSGESGFIIRMRDLNIEEQEAVKDALSINDSYEHEILRLNSVGPLIGAELKSKALVAIAIVILITILYIAYVFRNIAKSTKSDGSVGRVSSWTYSFVSIVALIHDITIPAAFAVIMGKFVGMEIDALFITALLSLLGYSINDTIIIFDRIRDNLRTNKERNNHESFEETVSKSLSQTYGRSINTSLTVFLVLIALYIFGGSSIEFFILTLIVGTVAGAYSSIFLAAPLLVTINNYRK